MNESGFMSLAACIADDDVVLHAKIRRSIASLTPAKAGSIGAVRMNI